MDEYKQAVVAYKQHLIDLPSAFDGELTLIAGKLSIVMEQEEGDQVHNEV